MSNDDDSSVAALQKASKKRSNVSAAIMTTLTTTLTTRTTTTRERGAERVRERHRWCLKFPGCRVGRGEEDDEQWIVRRIDACSLSPTEVDCAFYNNDEKKQLLDKYEKEREDEKDRA